MSPIPTKFRDRWRNRKEAAPGQGTVYWHVLMRDYPQVRDLARQAQERISEFSGFHMTPEEWLHVTTMVAGSTDEISRGQMNEMLRNASRTLDNIAPVSVVVGRILYHPEAIMLGISPERALDPVREAIGVATSKVIGSTTRSHNEPSGWKPHVTVAYSTAEQPAAPVVAAFGTELSSRAISIDTVTLVVQWGPERHWSWETIGAIALNDVSRSSDF